MPPTSIHFVYRFITSWRTFEKISGISRMTTAATCIHATRSCVSMRVSYNGFSCAPRNENPMVSGQVSKGARLLDLQVQCIFCQRCHSSGTQQDLIAAEVIGDMPENFPRVWHDIIRRFTKCIEVGSGHIEHLLQVNKMVFTDSISIVSFTTFLTFVLQTAYIHLYISCKWI